MATYIPDYYNDFRCIADKCRHTCCVGWEIDIDEDSLQRFLQNEYIAPHIDITDTPHIKLTKGERCPFLGENGLCGMIINCGEDMLCSICKDHPRFRNYWTGRKEVGLGLVCEEAARVILSWETKMQIIPQDPSNPGEKLPEDEQWLWDLRAELLANIKETGPLARLKEYLIFRHIPDALYDGLLEERIKFINNSFTEIKQKWAETDGSLQALTEIVRVWSYDTEYDDEVITKRLNEYKQP